MKKRGQHEQGEKVGCRPKRRLWEAGRFKKI